MSLIFPKKEILYAPMLGSLGGGSARGFGQRGGGKRKDPLVFLYPSEWFSYHGVDEYFIGGDTVFFHSNVNNFSFTSAQLANVSYLEYLVVGGGGSTPHDGGGWCSTSGGGGGGGSFGHLTGAEMTASYNTVIGQGGAGTSSAANGAGSNGTSSKLQLSSNVNVRAIGYGGNQASWCENLSATRGGSYAQGGNHTSNLGSNITGSNGGEGGMPQYDDGVEFATAGQNSAYGGGGGGGSSDSNTQYTIQSGGTGQTAVSWVSSSGGDGDGYQNQANKVATANRGGGAGGFASTASSASVTPDGADGFVAFHMIA